MKAYLEISRDGGLTTERVPGPESFAADEPVCRVCGCLDWNACINRWGETCWWVEEDLCSFCAAKEGGGGCD